MKAIVMVAHPDDCVIFAYGIIQKYPNLDWTICYLTYNDQDPRGQELVEFWNKRNVKTKFLGYIDDWHDIEHKQISFDEANAWIDIQEAVHNYDFVITHDADGDYGHLHHIFVHQAVADWHPNMITFAKVNKGNVQYTVASDSYTLDELPLHQTVVVDFFPNGHVNDYDIPESLLFLLESKR